MVTPPATVPVTHIEQVRDDHIVKLVKTTLAIHLLHPLALFVVAGSAAHGEPLLEQVETGPTRDVSTGTSDKNWAISHSVPG